jgi:hypothetical protein
VEEWQQISFTDFRRIALLGIAAAILIAPLVRVIKLNAEELVLLGIGFVFAVRHQRMLFVFGILAAPVLCRVLATAHQRYDDRRDSALLNGLMIALFVGLIVLSFPSRRSLESQVESSNPANALRFLNKSGLTGRVLNEYVFGGYLIWSRPEHKVFIDGRADLYESAGVLKDYSQWITLRSDPKGILEKYNITVCLLSKNALTARVISLLPNWKEVYSDKLSVIFARQSTY